jgi:hypothetical protein
VAVGAVLAIFLGILVGALLLADVAGIAGLGPFKTVHVLLATVAAAIVFVAAFTSSAPLAWVAALAVVFAGSAGLATWRRSVRAPADGRPAPSPALLLVHGAAAVLALVCIVVAAASR